MDIRPGYHHQYNAQRNNEKGYLILATIMGLGFLFSVSALTIAMVALCR